MDAFAGVLLFVLLLVAVVLLVGLAAMMGDTIIQLVSGELGTLMPRRPMGRGTRFRRAAELQSVVSRLALIARLNLPWGPALDAAAAGEPARIRPIFAELSRRLCAGVPLSEALATAFRGCPAALTAALRRAERCGQLAAALTEQERMIAAATEAHLNTTTHGRHAVAYAAAMLLFTGTMVFEIMIFVMPKYKEIFNDFDVILPRATITLIGAASWVTGHLAAILAVLLFVALSVLLVFVLASRMSDQSVLARVVAWVRWHLPVTRTLDFGLGMSRAIRSMALDTRSGAPVASLMSLPSVVSTTNHLRSRLAMFAQSVTQGVVPHQAAREAKLGDVFVCALRMVERGEDPDRTLRHAADYYEAIAYRWWHALTALSVPLFTLALGALVGMVVLALFLPLVALIDVVSEAL